MKFNLSQVDKLSVVLREKVLVIFIYVFRMVCRIQEF